MVPKNDLKLNDGGSGIQALRAVAALLVLLQHAIFFACTTKGVDFVPYLPVGFGWMGVSIFFVISGYVMTQCLHQGASFMPQRLARIYPPYFITVAISGAVLPLIGKPWGIDLWSVSLLPATTFNESYAIPYWNLIYELVFYCVIYLLVLCNLSRPVMLLCCGLWAAAIIVFGSLGIPQKFSSDIGAIMAGNWILLSPANLLFITGVVYGLVGRKYLEVIAWPIVTVLLFGSWWLAQFAGGIPLYLRFVLWALAYVALLDLFSRMRPPQLMVAMGNYSYGLYLIHTIAILVTVEVTAKWHPEMPLWVVIAMLLTIPAVTGCAFGALEYRVHHVVIRPLFKTARKFSSVVVVALTGFVGMASWGIYATVFDLAPAAAPGMTKVFRPELPAALAALASRDGGACFLDAINGLPIGASMTAQSGSLAEFIGWAVADPKFDKPGAGVLLELQGAQSYYAEAVFYHRSGLGKVLGNESLDSGGVTLKDVKLPEESGRYKVIFLIRAGDDLLRCHTGKELAI